MKPPENNPREIQPNITRENTVSYLITAGLGYCCEWAFFNLFIDKPTSLIADRLGVTKRAVNIHKRAWREGKTTCRELPVCFLCRTTTVQQSSSDKESSK